MHVLEEKLLSGVPEEGFMENVQEQLFLRMGQGLIQILDSNHFLPNK